tara:strand:- start:12449 stop:12781 length:333 start_codon:yes stop_codon:yes gene_type:complete
MEFFGELDAGIFADKLGSELSNLAMAVVEHGRAGKLTIEIGIKQIGHHHQVNVIHKMTATRPTLRGKKTEEDVTETPMHVGKGGKLTVFPEEQMDLLPKQPKSTYERNPQ